MPTKISITITITKNGTPETFTQECESKNDDGTTLWPAIVTGLELVMSKIHRRFFPTEDEQKEDQANA